jgi:hypothetical protein
MKVSSIERGAGTFIFPLPDEVLQTGDHLVIQDTPGRLKEFGTRLGVKRYIRSEMKNTLWTSIIHCLRKTSR